MIVPTGKPLDHLGSFIECPHCKGAGQIDVSTALPAASSERSGREAVDLAEIERVARKVNPGRSEDHIKSVALDCLSIIRNLAGTKAKDKP